MFFLDLDPLPDPLPPDPVAQRAVLPSDQLVVSDDPSRVRPGQIASTDEIARGWSRYLDVQRDSFALVEKWLPYL